MSPKLPLLLALTVVLVAIGCRESTPDGSDAAARAKAQAISVTASENIEEIAPDFAATSLAGNTISLSESEAEILVINFWATWCKPCLKEMPDFAELQTDYDGKVQFVGVSTDPPDLTDKVEAYAKRLNVNYPIIVDDGSISRAYGEVSVLPVTYVLKRDDLSVIRTFVGLASKEELSTIFDAHI